jgi:hypothetical protein
MRCVEIQRGGAADERNVAARDEKLRTGRMESGLQFCDQVPRGALSFTPRLQPGDQGGFSLLTVSTVYQAGAETVETVEPLITRR